MTTLATTICGLTFANPIFLGSGPAGNSGAKLAWIAQEGRPGAVVTKTVYPTQRAEQPSPKVARVVERKQLVGLDPGGRYALADWVQQQMPLALAGGVPVIGNVGSTGQIADSVVVAEGLAAAGAAALELNLASPAVHLPFFLDGRAYAIISAVRQAVQLPLIVKLPHMYPPHVVEYAGKAIEAGADALTVVGNVAGTAIDIAARRHAFLAARRQGPVYGTTKAATLAIVQTIASNFPGVPVIGSGGVRDGSDVIEYVMAGATAVAMLTEVMYKGPKLLQKVAHETFLWLQAHGVGSLDEIRGCVLDEIGQENTTILKAIVDRRDLCTGCGECVTACQLYQYDYTKPLIVLDAEDKAVVLEDCVGCGWCAAVCPRDCIHIPELAREQGG